MSLIKAVFSLVNKKLIGNGWDKLLAKVAGLRLNKPTPAKLAAELARPLRRVDRTFSGFEDFALAGNRGIEPGSPARSLLFHALASPNVLDRGNGSRLGYFPTLKELEDVENYVFGVKPPKIDELIKRATGSRLAIIVFSSEYRPASQTTHGVHADMVYARTGIARVGTRPANYRSDLRGFQPEESGEPFGICVSPARYAVYLAVRRPGDRAAGRPMRFQEKASDPSEIGDDGREFWVPIHKLFSGIECIARQKLRVEFKSRHFNEKIYRIHKFVLKKRNPPRTFPYRFTNLRIAKVLNADEDHGSGVVLPTVQDALVEEARFKGDLLTFTVPEKRGANFSSLDLSDQSRAPSYVHIRTEIRHDGTPFNLNDLSEVALMAATRHGQYQALHYVDFTGEGWVTARIIGLKSSKFIDAAVRAAYSLVSAPDFFPSCDQRELSEWAETRLPKSLTRPPPGDDTRPIWNVNPDALCDTRLPANLQLKKPPPFAADEDTITALVPALGATSPDAVLRWSGPAAQRHSHLPDDAAGIFAPGWDVSVDELKRRGRKTIEHLAGYPLGSPFPEDAKLCAALSTFWPAVAPDSTREMEPSRGNQSGTVAPLTDQEIGQVGDLPWDGVAGPSLVALDGHEFVEYASFQHVDYVRTALQGKLSLRLTARVDSAEYVSRVLAAAFAYLSLGAERTSPPRPMNPRRLADERSNWKMLSFRCVAQGSPELEQARQQAGLTMHGCVYRMEAYKPREQNEKGKRVPGSVPTTSKYRFAIFPVPGNVQKKRLQVLERYIVFVAPETREVALRRSTDSAFHAGQFHV
jgi:hypothetical protein